MSALKLYNYIKAQYLSGVLWTEFLWQDETYERQNIAYFSQVWNEFINSMREEDLISDRYKLQTTAFLTHLALDDRISSIWLYLLTTNFPGIEICFLSHTVQVMFLSFSGLHSCLLVRCVIQVVPYGQKFIMNLWLSGKAFCFLLKLFQSVIDPHSCWHGKRL